MFEIANIVNSNISTQKLSELTEINSRSAYYNLVLSDEDIMKLISERNVSLKYAERVEFGFDTLETIINEFYKSPYINQFEYTEVLGELQFIFYAIKNEVGEVFADEELIILMAELFNNACAGSLELLKGKGAEYIFELAKHKKQESDMGTELLKAAPGFANAGGLNISFAGADELLLKNSLAVILEELALKYTRGRSFSISTETAVSIAKSVLYAARIAGESSYGLEKLRNAYYDGLRIIEGLLNDSRRLYIEVKKTKLQAAINYYTETIESFGSFLNNYDKEFASSEIPANISYYPVLCNTRLEGVEFVKEYLSCLAIENEICGLFDTIDIEWLLAAMEEKEEKSRTLLQPNIFEIIVNNSLVAAIAGKKPSELLLTEADKQALSKIAINEVRIDEAVNYFLQYFNIERNVNLSEYLRKYVDIKLKSLAGDTFAADYAVFVKQEPKEFLYQGNQMPDALFRELIVLLNDETEFEMKLRLIRKNVCSLNDVIDLLNEGVFCGNEYKDFFASLSADETQILHNTVKLAAIAVDDTEPRSAGRVCPDDVWVKEFFEYYEGWLNVNER